MMYTPESQRHQIAKNKVARLDLSNDQVFEEFNDFVEELFEKQKEESL